MRLIFGAIWLLGLFSPLQGATTEKWLKIQTRHFTILTAGTDASARQWAGELEQFEAGLQHILPVAEDRLRPVTVVLFRTDKMLRPFKPLEKGRPQNIAGFFAKMEDSQAIALALDYPPQQIREMIYHETVHWHTSASDRELPPWLVEGLAEVYSTFRPKGEGHYAFGSLIPDHVERMQNMKLMPVEKLTTIAHGSLSYNEGNRATLFYAESWALVHYLLFGQDAQGMDSIVRYLQVTEKIPVAAEAFRRAFGASYGEVDQRLAQYMRGGTYHTYTYKVADVDMAGRSAVQPATESEVELALGILLLGARGERTPEAVARLERSAKLSPGRPEVWQALGEAALLAKDNSEAADYFGRSVAAGSTSYFVHYGLGATRTHGLVIGTFSDTAEISGAAANFRRAIELNPRYVPAYEGLAGLLPAVDTPDAKDQARLEYARLLAPDSAIIDVGLSVCDFKAGRRANGRNRLELILTLENHGQREARNLAETLLKDDDWNQFNGRLEKLFKQRDYAGAMAAIDAVKNEFSDRRYREVLLGNRRTAENNLLIGRAVDCANSGQIEEARTILQKVSTENVEGQAHSEARRLLRELEKMTRAAR